jgi:hypothetical protein
MRIRMTTGTAWAIPMRPDGSPELQGFRGTFKNDGSFAMARGGEPHFDPATAVYFTSDYVQNVTAANGIQINGDVISGRRLSSVTHTWKQGMTLDELLAHKHLGKSMPSREVIVAFHAARNVEVEC